MENRRTKGESRWSRRGPGGEKGYLNRRGEGISSGKRWGKRLGSEMGVKRVTRQGMAND